MTDIVLPFHSRVKQVLQYHYGTQRSVKHATVELFSFFSPRKSTFCGNPRNNLSDCRVKVGRGKDAEKPEKRNAYQSVWSISR